MKRPYGFTLVELMVALSIVALITTAVVANLRGRAPVRQLENQGRNLASLLRQAQVLAIAGQPVNGNIPSGGYGVRLASCPTGPCQVTLFADLNGNFSYDTGEEQQVLDLGSDISINSVSVADPLHVIFRPPAALICFNNACSGSTTAQIVLGVRGVSDTIKVTIQQLSGQITSS